MSQRAPAPVAMADVAPRHGGMLATLVLFVPVAVLAWPMLAGRWLVGAMSDQYGVGYAFREWGSAQWRTTGHVPLWNPELFGGLPFIAAQHGDIFYWTSLLRLLLPTEVVMNLGFVVHFLAAGLFTYLLLRAHGVSWAGAVVAGVAYELSGLVASYPAPGHDGKLFVTALLPAALLALTIAIRRRRPEAFAALAAVIGLALLSPHYQMTYYLLVVAGIYGALLTFADAPPALEDAAAAGAGPAPRGWRWWVVALGIAAVLVGFGVAMLQIMPFYEYLPFSPRAEGYYGWEGSTSYAIPWSHVPEFFISGFTGTTFARTYWASNPLKLHSEYLGLPVLALAAVGAMRREHRRLVLWLGGIGLLFLLISLGAATPFYRVWWTLMPYVKQTRAPGMAFFVVALMAALLAGLGAEQLLRVPGRRFERLCWIAGGALAFLGMAGAVGGFAASIASPEKAGTAYQMAGTLRLSAVLGGLILVAVGVTIRAMRTGKAPRHVAALLLAALVAGDLVRNALPFWTWNDPPRQGLYRTDPIIDYLTAQPLPFRIFDLSDTGVDVYGGAVLMAFGVPQILGHHGNQLDRFNVVMGVKNEWRLLFASRRIWDLYAVNYVLLPTGIDLASQLPAFQNLAADFDTVMAGVQTSSGREATLLRRRQPVPYVHLVAGAIKADDDRAAALLADQRQPGFQNQLVLLATDAPIDPEPITELPERPAANARVSAWAPGHMTVQIEPAADRNGYVVVAENWYPGWRATVDGAAGQAVRGDVAQIVVPVRAGAHEIRLDFVSPPFERGLKVTWASLALIGLGLVVPPIVRSRRRA